MVDIYPDQKGYLVNWLGGSGGGFLLTLLYINDTGLAGPFSITNEAVGHHNLRYLNKNWDRESSLKYHQEYLNKAPIYEIIQPHNKSKPVYWYDHYPCDPDVFFIKYPSCKLAIISLSDEEEKQLCYGNLFFKTPGLFNDVKKNNVGKFEPYTSQKDIPLDVLKMHLTTVYDCVKPDKIFEKNEKIPLEHKDRMYKIDYKKLVSDKEYMLDMVSTITSRPISLHSERFVQQYMDKQRQLVETRMPWLLDYLYNT